MSTNLDRVADAAERVTQAENTLTVARKERDSAILATLNTGTPLAQVARAAGLTRQAIYKLKNQRP